MGKLLVRRRDPHIKNYGFSVVKIGRHHISLDWRTLISFMKSKYARFSLPTHRKTSADSLYPSLYKSEIQLALTRKYLSSADKSLLLLQNIWVLTATLAVELHN